MPQIRPIRDLRDTTAISDACRSSQEPIFIAKNCYGDMAVISMDTYERDLAFVDIYRKLAKAEKQVTEGKLLDVDEVFARLREKHGQ